MAANMKKIIILVIQAVFSLFLHVYGVKGYTEISMTDNLLSDCYEVFHDPGGIIKAYGPYFDLGTFDCQVTIESDDPTQQYELRFENFDVYSEDGLCDDHYLQIFDGYDRAAQPLTNKLCQPKYDSTRRDLPRPVYTTREAVTLYLYRYSPPGPSYYRIIFTAYKREYDEDCFRCLNNSAMCIDGDLTCDSLRHCTDGSDESSEGKGGCSESTGIFTGVSFAVMISIVILVGVILVIISAALCAYWCRRGQSETPRYTSNAIYKPTTKVDYPRTQNAQSYSRYGYSPPAEPDYATAQTPAGYPSQIQQGSSDTGGTPRQGSMSYNTEQDDVSIPLKTDTMSTRS